MNINTSIFTRKTLVGLGGGLLMLAATGLEASPLHVQLDGSVIAGTGGGSPLVGTPMFADLFFDLDEANALVKESFAPTGEPAFTRWTFSGGDEQRTPYNQTSFTGNFGSFANPVFLEVETIDNLDADSIGNPFDVTGIIDVLSVFATTDVVNCAGGFNDPITGCSIPGAPVLNGQTHAVNFVADANWFSGSAVLPASLLPFADFKGVFGSVEVTENSILTATADVQYTSQPYSGPAAVPAPQTALLMLTGLLALVARQRSQRRTGLHGAGGRRVI